MPTIPCQAVIDSCLPCRDEPLINTSAESPDVDRYISRFSFLNTIPPIRQYPDFDEQGGGIFLQVGCMRWCWSTVSQDDADDCARRQAVECAFAPLMPGFPTPDEFHPNRIALYYNQAVAGTYVCPDGNVFTYTIAANQIVALTQGEANAIAFALAKLRAKEHRVCISDMNDPICVDTWVTKQITASGPNVAVFPATDRWELVSGTIPTGMTLETGFTSDGISLSGIPTTIGEYSFRVRVTISTFGSPGFGDFMEKVFAVKIVGIEQSSPLPDAPLGVAYSQQLSASFSSDHELETWSITSGSLPDGLTLSTAGLIEGTPTGSEAGYSFTVQAQFPVGSTTAVCSKDFSITTNANPGLPDAFWKFDEAAGPALDATGNGHDLALQSGNPVASTTGKIATSRLIPPTAGTIGFILQPNAPSIDITNGISCFGWVRVTAHASADHRNHCFRYAVTNAALSIKFAMELTNLITPDRFTFRLFSTQQSVDEDVIGPLINLNQWYFFGMVYNASTGLTSVSLDAGTTFSGISSMPILFTGPQDRNEVGGIWTDLFVGSFDVDECGLYRRILSGAEITNLYNGGAGKTCCPLS